MTVLEITISWLLLFAMISWAQNKIITHHENTRNEIEMAYRRQN